MKFASSKAFRDLSVHLSATVVPKKWTPKQHHAIAVEFGLTRGGAGLALDPGLGKTSITYKIFCILQGEHAVETLLVIAPLRPAHLVWPKERDKWLDFNHLSVAVLHGTKKEQLLAEKHDVYVINPEGLPWLFKHKLFVKKFKGQMLAVDESTKFKNTRSKMRFKLLKPHLKLFKRRLILTGSLVANGLLDLFGQHYIVDMGSALGQYITHYRMRWFVPTGFGGFTWVIRDKQAEQDIYKAVAPSVLRLASKDYQKLPKLLRPTVEIELPKEAMQIYNSMDALMVASILNREVSAKNAGVASQKCRQIANGGLYLDEFDGAGERIKLPKGAKRVSNGRPWAPLHDAKTDAVCDLLEQLQGAPALIAYDFHHDRDRLLAALGDGPVLGAGVSMKETKAIEALWNAGKLPWVLLHPTTAAHGLNLQESGQHLLLHSLLWNFEEYDQLIRRLLRTGQRATRIFAHHFIAKGTVDEIMAAVLLAKERTQNTFYDALVAYAKADGETPSLHKAGRARKKP